MIDGDGSVELLRAERSHGRQDLQRRRRRRRRARRRRRWVRRGRRWRRLHSRRVHRRERAGVLPVVAATASQATTTTKTTAWNQRLGSGAGDRGGHRARSDARRDAREEVDGLWMKRKATLTSARSVFNRRSQWQTQAQGSPIRRRPPSANQPLGAPVSRPNGPRFHQRRRPGRASRRTRRGCAPR